MHIGVGSSAEASSCVLRFLNDAVPAHVFGESHEQRDEHVWRVSACVFLDYTAVELEFKASAPDENSVVLTVRHVSQNDVLRFHRIIDMFTAYLASSSLHDVGGPPSWHASHRLIDDDDFAVDEQEAASTLDRTMLIESKITSPCAAQREEGYRALVFWAARPEASPGILTTEKSLHSQTSQKQALAQMLVRLHAGGDIFKVTAPSLSEMYPLAVALNHISDGTSPEACALLCDSQIPDALQKLLLSDLPAVVTKEFQVVVKSLRLWHKFSGAKRPHVEFSSDSTRCTDVPALVDDDAEI